MKLWCSYCKRNGDGKHTYLTCQRKHLRCTYCQSIGRQGGGHTAEQCFKNPDNICIICGHAGHTVESCKYNKTTKTICINCGKRTHTILDCPYPLTTCYNCGEKGHKQDYCPKNTMECEYCGRKGHSLAICPVVPKNQFCPVCPNGEGHTIENCRIMRRLHFYTDDK